MLTKQQARAMFAKLSDSEKKTLFVKSGMKPEYVDDFTLHTLPFNQMNPVIRRKITKLLDQKKENLKQKLHESGVKARQSHIDALSR